VYFLAKYSNISHLKINKNIENISLYLRKFAVFAFYLFGSGLFRLGKVPKHKPKIWSNWKL